MRSLEPRRDARRLPRVRRHLQHTSACLICPSAVDPPGGEAGQGHGDTVVTETVYRFQLQPVLLEGAEAMDGIYPAQDEA